MALVNAFGDIALDSSVQDVKTSVDDVNTTLVAIQALQQNISDLNENLLGLMSALYNALPRLTANKQAAISIEAGSVGISAAQTLATVTTVGTINTVTTQTQIGGQEALTVARSQIMAGTQHIYNNIVVS